MSKRTCFNIAYVALRNVIIILLLLCINISYAQGGACIAAGDFGLGGLVLAPANPDENNTSGKSKLIRKEPKKQQIAPWVDSGLYTLGNPPNNVNDPEKNDNALKLVITGRWNPWGSVTGIDYDSCPLKNCDPGKNEDALCWNDGKVVDDSDLDKLPCDLSKGIGLYGLIALANSGSGYYQHPNKDESTAATLPNELFRTFRIYPTEKGARINAADPDAEPEYEYHFRLDATQVCDENGCVKDIHPEGSEYVKRGRLFFKILDNFYEDNTGSFNINVVSGVYTEKGFIERIVTMFSNQIDKVSKSLYQNIVKNTHLIGIIRAMLTLYVAITGLMFALGMIRTHHRELVVRLLKFGIVATLISDQSWSFFNDYLFTLCKDGAAAVADIIIRSTLFYESGSPVYYMPSQATPLSIYDVILKILTQPPVHIKICSLLFYKWQLYWIPCIYICIFFVILSILRSLMLYLMMLMQVALLLIVSPIFIIMLLFQQTKELFDTWLKQVAATGMIYILISASIALMVKVIFGQIQELLYFRVCWQTVWSLEIIGITLLKLVFWYPQSASELSMAINPLNFLAFLLMSIVFFSVMNQIPRIVDMLIGNARMGIAMMYDKGMIAYSQSAGVATRVVFNTAKNSVMFIGRKGAAVAEAIAQDGKKKAKK